MKIRVIAATLLIGLILSACSDAPDAADVEQSIEGNIRAKLEQYQTVARRNGGEKAGEMLERMHIPTAHEIDISDVTIDSSKQLESGDYQLQVTYQATVRNISRRSSTQVILGKRDGEWTVLN